MVAIQQRINFLLSYFRSSKRRIIVTALITSLISIFLFISGSSYLFFRYYDSLVKNYYDSLLKGVSSFQEKIIKRETYRKDLELIASSLKKNRGIDQVWITDRSGKLIYSTDIALSKEYISKQLPADYFRSINNLWKFQNGYPKANILSIKDLILLRISIPIYAFNKGEHDFVLGLDVRRFIYLPEKNFILFSLLSGYFALSFLLLFLPIFLWVRSRFQGMTSQTQMVISSLVLEEKKPVTEVKEKEVPLKEEKEEEAEEEIREEVKEEKVTEKVVPMEREEEPVIVQKSPVLRFVELKQRHFKKQDLELPFLQGSCFVFHSKVSMGSYTLYHKSDSNHYFALFSYPESPIETAEKQLLQIVEYLKGEMSQARNDKEIAVGFNGYCLKNSLKLDLSLILIRETEKKVEYSSCGKGYAYYLKSNEEIVKELVLKVPKLGSLPEREFEEEFSFADIRFVSNDLFVLLPHNFPEIKVKGETFDNFLRTVILTGRDLKASEIGRELQRELELIRREGVLPETGYVILKFL